MAVVQAQAIAPKPPGVYFLQTPGEIPARTYAEAGDGKTLGDDFKYAPPKLLAETHLAGIAGRQVGCAAEDPAIAVRARREAPISS